MTTKAIQRSTGSWKLPQPLDVKEDGEWASLPRIARTVPFGYELDEEDDKILRPIASELDALVEAFRPYLDHGLIQEGLHIIADNFDSEKDIGPTFIADFEEIVDPEEREMKQRDAYERVNYILSRLGIVWI